MQFNVCFDEKDSTVYAELTPGDGEPVSQLSLTVKLEALGYRNLRIPPDALKELIKNAQEETECKIALKTIIDATVSISISADKRQALLTLTAADAGEELTIEKISQAISDANVVDELIQKEVVQRSFERKKVENICFAEARLPIQGDEAQYIPLVSSEIELPPSLDEHGVADMLSTHKFQLVEIDTPLMKRIPPSQGTPGIDVVGTKLDAAEGNDPGFIKDLTGAIISAEDSNVLIAQVRGHPVIMNNGVKVDPTLHVEKVDLNTGNITFDGSLEVNGDVVPGMSIDVTGNVLIKGSVERSHIKAGNNITIGGGVFGGEKEKGKLEQEGIDSHSDETDSKQFELQAGGNIEAKFINLSSLYAKNNIIAKEYIGNSEIKADSDILLGQQGGKGVLFGGYSEAVKRIAANRIGTESYVPTHIKVGRLDQLVASHKQYKKKIAKRLKELDQLNQILTKIKQAGTPATLGKLQLDKARKISNTINAISEKNDDLSKKLLHLDTLIERHKGAKVDVVKAIFPNTVIDINGTIKTITTDMRGCSLVLRGKEIIENNDKD